MVNYHALHAGRTFVLITQTAVLSLVNVIVYSVLGKNRIFAFVVNVVLCTNTEF